MRAGRLQCQEKGNSYMHISDIYSIPENHKISMQ